MDSRWDKISNGLGLLLVGLAMAMATWNVFLREVEIRDPNKTVISVSHTLLDAGLREALDAVASEYVNLQADRGNQVHIRLIDVPDQVYAQWIRTQLIGGTAPHVVFTGHSQGFDTSLTSRYLVPISDVVEVPNPYNEGTSQEGVPWRYTFFDGMNIAGYNFSLAEHFGVPLSATTNRLFINRDLLFEILEHPSNGKLKESLGDGFKAATAADLFAICEAVHRYSRATGRSLAPIAGAQENARQLMRFLFSSVTQEALFEWDKDLDLWLPSVHIVDQLRLGELSYDNPLFRRGFSLLREISQFMQPGFFQMRRQDATFYFVQENALMIMASSWDAASFRALVGDRFEMLVLPIPTPSKDDPYYGEYVLGNMSEANVTPGGTFSFVNYHPEDELALALDFMQYATSVPGNGLFARRSGWLPSIFGVEPIELNEPFMPQLEGFPGGPDYELGNADIRRAVETRFHLLFSRDGSVDKFYRSLLPEVEALYRGIMEKDHQDMLRSLQQQDTMLGGAFWLQSNDLEGGESKVSAMIDAMIRHEAHVLRGKRSLKQPDGSLR